MRTLHSPRCPAPSASRPQLQVIAASVISINAWLACDAATRLETPCRGDEQDTREALEASLPICNLLRPRTHTVRTDSPAMPPARDYFSFGIPGSDDHSLRGVGSDHLLTPSEALGYLSPLNSPRLAAAAGSSSSSSSSGHGLAALSKEISEAASEPISSEQLQARLAERAQANEARTRGRQLSPSQLAAVLSQDPSPAPEPQARFLHGGPPLSDLEAPSAALPNSEKRNKPIANSEWRAFSDEEEKHLQAAWRALQTDTEAQQRRDQKRGKETVKGEGGIRRVNEDEADPGDSPYLVPVGLDNLFTVSLLHHVLYPAFWTGTPVRVLLCHWFYAPPSPPPNAASLPSHLIKPYPVDPSLSAALDKAYNSIRPWDESYAAELGSALRGGKEAQQRLSVALGVLNEAGTEDNLGIEVIFENEGKGRVYSKGMMASVSKAFLSSGKSLGGGQVVLRGAPRCRSSDSQLLALTTCDLNCRVGRPPRVPRRENAQKDGGSGGGQAKSVRAG